MLSRSFRCRSLYKLKSWNRCWKIFKISLLGRPAHLGSRTKTLQVVSFILLLLRQLGLRKVKNHLELIMASRILSSALNFSMVRAKISPDWLNIGGKVSKIMLGDYYWWSYPSGSCILNDREKKKGKARRFCLDKFFRR